MAVLANPDECYVDRSSRQHPTERLAHIVGITGAGDRMEALDSSGLNQPLAEVPSETGGMRIRQAHVFIEVKHVDPPPVHTGLRPEAVEEGDLRRPGGRDDASGTVRRDRGPEAGGRFTRRNAREGQRVGEDRNAHARDGEYSTEPGRGSV